MKLLTGLFKNKRPLVQIQVKVHTPKGEATKVNKRVGGLMQSMIIAGAIHKTEIDQTDSNITWTVQCTADKALAISRRAGMYTAMIQQIFNNKTMKKTIINKLNQEDQEKIKKMLTEDTQVEIIQDDPPIPLQASEVEYPSKDSA